MGLQRIYDAEDHANREISGYCRRNDCAAAKRALAERDRLIEHLKAKAMGVIPPCKETEGTGC